MTFLAPGYLFAAAAVAGVIAALHFIVMRQPRVGILPTARFIPDTPAITVAAAKRPTDLPLMLLRMLIALAAGAALARPMLAPSRRAEARVIVVDLSRSVRDPQAVRDSVRSAYRDGDALVLFDSSARLVIDGARDSVGVVRPTEKQGNLSAALLKALRAGSRLRDRADSLQLVIVSPFAREEFDAATDTIRSLWLGRARLVRIPTSLSDTIPATRGLAINGASNDALAVTAGIARRDATGNSLIDRGSADVTAQAPRDAGHAVISWPASARPRFAAARSVIDTVSGVTTGDANVVAGFVRAWIYPPDSMQGASIVARWIDGEPAAIEKPDGIGCVRSVAIPATPVGDLVMRHEFVRLVTSLSGPCAWRTALLPADPAAIARLEGSGGEAPRTAFRPMTDVRSTLAPWLLALAIAAALAELLLRRRARTADALDTRSGKTGDNEARAA
jgi:hypothetical protein